jgi:hypothetical protein
MRSSRPTPAARPVEMLSGFDDLVRAIGELLEGRGLHLHDAFVGIARTMTVYEIAAGLELLAEEADDRGAGQRLLQSARQLTRALPAGRPQIAGDEPLIREALAMVAGGQARSFHAACTNIAKREVEVLRRRPAFSPEGVQKVPTVRSLAERLRQKAATLES